MKRFAFVSMMFAIALVIAACTPKATPEICQAACDNQNNLTKAQAAADETPDPVSVVEAAFAPKFAEIEKAKTEALAALDAEYATKIAADANLATELETKKTEKANEFVPQLTQLTADREAAMAKAREEAATAAAAKLEAEKAAVGECAQQCVATGVSEPVAKCRAAAGDLAAFAACK
jgi:SWI/SNF-related matrix-associated actin-dependent regulator 1 of chromatin subfamily A